MTRTAVLTWLGTRRPAPPAALRSQIERAVTDSTAALPDHLAEVGRALLGRVASQPQGGRELALDLLAADACVTYAFEAQAEEDVGAVARLAEGVRP